MRRMFLSKMSGVVITYLLSLGHKLPGTLVLSQTGYGYPGSRHTKIGHKNWHPCHNTTSLGSFDSLQVSLAPNTWQLQTQGTKKLLNFYRWMSHQLCLNDYGAAQQCQWEASVAWKRALQGHAYFSLAALLSHCHHGHVWKVMCTARLVWGLHSCSGPHYLIKSSFQWP